MKDINRKKNYSKGSESTTVKVGKSKDFFHCNVNPNKRNVSYDVAKYDKCQYKLLLN